MSEASKETLIPQHSLSRSTLLHFLPGICIMCFYLLSAPWLSQNGFQPSFGVLLGFLLVGIPLQMGIMLREGYKLNGKYSFQGVIHYRTKLRFWHYLVLGIIFIVYALLLVSLLGPVNEFFLEEAFAWLPEWLRNSSPPLDESYPLFIVVISFLALFLIDGIINPIMEEIYFRGYLMPRLSRFGVWSPIISAFLFSIVHFWQPWNALQIFILVAPIYYLVWRKKSIFISIVLHCLANLIGASLSLLQYLSA